MKSSRILYVGIAPYFSSPRHHSSACARRASERGMALRPRATRHAASAANSACGSRYCRLAGGMRFYGALSRAQQQQQPLLHPRRASSTRRRKPTAAARASAHLVQPLRGARRRAGNERVYSNNAGNRQHPTVIWKNHHHLPTLKLGVKSALPAQLLSIASAR